MDQHDENQYILIFASYSQAVFLYNELINQGCDIKMASAPCTLSNGCARYIKFKGSYMELILEQIKQKNIRSKGIYKVTKNCAGNLKYVEVKGP